MLQDGLQTLQQNDFLNLLVIEDRFTRGLTGPEISSAASDRSDGAGNFAALVRNNLDTQKTGGGAGGSFGLGKAVYTLCSRFGLTLYHSRLHDGAVLTDKGQPRLRGRVIGKAELPWHVSPDGREWAGPGWMGLPVPGSDGKPLMAHSVWENDALIHDLYLDRLDDVPAQSQNAVPSGLHDDPGTSIQIVGVYDPSGEVPEDIQKIGDRLEEETARNFFPALLSGRLEVRVALWDGCRRIRVSRVMPERFFPGFADAYERRSEALARPERPGDVATARIPLEIPARKVFVDGRTRRAGEPIQHEALLVVRLDTDSERQDAESGVSPARLPGHLAVFRGREMVVQFRDLRRLVPAGTPPFHALMLCGTAAGTTLADQAAEEFLRTAEPPSHDCWEPNADLLAQYIAGGGRRIQMMFQAAAQTTQEMLRPRDQADAAGPEALRKMMRLLLPEKSPLGASAAAALPRVVRAKGSVDAEGCWTIEGEILIPDSSGWQVRPVLLFDMESGGASRVPWESLSAGEDGEQRGNLLLLPPGARRVRFLGRSQVSAQPVRGNQAAIRVELRDFRRLSAEQRAAVSASVSEGADHS